MNNSELADQLSTATGITKADARKYVDAITAAIGDAAAKGEEVSLSGFGKFKVTARPERPGRNPANGEAITVPASRKVGFTAAKALKDKVNA